MFIRLLRKIVAIRSLINYFYLFKLAIQEINRIKADIVIYRYIWLPLPFNPKIINRNIIFVTDHQTKEEYELEPILSFIEHFNFKITSKIIDGIIGVTKEIVDYEINRCR